MTLMGENLEMPLSFMETWTFNLSTWNIVLVIYSCITSNSETQQFKITIFYCLLQLWTQLGSCLKSECGWCDSHLTVQLDWKMYFHIWHMGWGTCTYLRLARQLSRSTWSLCMVILCFLTDEVSVELDFLHSGWFFPKKVFLECKEEAVRLLMTQPQQAHSIASATFYWLRRTSLNSLWE